MSMLFRATLFSGMASLVAMIAQAAKGKVTALVLGPEGMGLLTQMTLLLGVAVTVGGMGLQQGVIRYVSEYSSTKQYEKLNALYSTFITALLFTSCLLLLFGIVFSQNISKALLGDDKYAIYVSLIFLVVPFSIFAAYYQALLSGIKAIEERARLLVYANIASLPISIVLIYSFELRGAIFALIALYLILLMLGRFYIKQLIPHRLSFSVKNFKFKFIKLNSTYGVVGMAMVLLGSLTTLTITSIITAQLSIKMTGIFSVTWQISTVYLGMFMGAITTYYYPVLCELTDHSSISIEVNRAVRHFASLITPAVIGLICFNVPLITILFSTDFLLSGKLLAYYLPGDFFRIIYEALGLVLLAKGKLLPYAFLYVFWCVSYLCCTYIGVTWFGIDAVALSYTVSYAMVAVITYFSVRRLFELRLERETTKSLIYASSAISASVLVALNMQTMLSGLFGIFFLYLYSGKQIKNLLILALNKWRGNHD